MIAFAQGLFFFASAQFFRSAQYSLRILTQASPFAAHVAACAPVTARALVSSVGVLRGFLKMTAVPEFVGKAPELLPVGTPYPAVVLV